MRVSTAPRHKNAGRPPEKDARRHPCFIPASKRCEQCGVVFTRDDKPGIIYGNFMAMRYCSPECSADALRLNPIENFWNKVDKRGPRECWPWLGHIGPKGYGTHWVGKGHKRAHRYSFQLATGIDPGPRIVMHKCDVRNCVNPAHLRLGTQTENIADMDRKRRRGAAYGERHGCAQLTSDQVRAIRADPRPHREIARDYPIGKSGVSAIKSGRTWRHL